MELTEQEALAIKKIYSAYHSGEIYPETALDKLELVLNGVEDTED